MQGGHKLNLGKSPKNNKQRVLTFVLILLVLERVKQQIKSRGAKTIRGLGRTFRNFDSFDGNHKIDADEFYSGLCEI